MMADHSEYPQDLLAQVWDYPLGRAIAGRRSRRFGLGMELPGGPMAFKSRHAPFPLSEAEQTLLICATTGVTGWNFGIPYSTGTPDSHANYAMRLAGRTFPTGAGVGTPELFYTDDNGVYLVKTRDLAPVVEQPAEDAGELELMVRQVKEATTKLSDKRLEVPRQPPHISEHNLWNANLPGTTLLMPVTDLSEHLFSSLTMRLISGYYVYDDMAKRPAGNLEPYVRSGFLSKDKPAALSLMEQNLFVTGVGAITPMAHNAMLTMQAIGLGGWMFTGISAHAAMGAFKEPGFDSLGFRFYRDERWNAPNPVGLDGHYEGVCPPYYPDMRSAAREIARRKFGEGGAYDPDTEGPFSDNRRVKGSVVPYSEEFVECLGEIAQYIYDTYGKFPGTVPTMLMCLYVQAQHIDLEFYDAQYREGAYLDTHRQHMARWHNLA